MIGCYLLSKPKDRGYRTCMLSLWLNKGMFWLSEQRLVDQASTIHRHRWMTELGIEELERNLAESDIYKEEERSADDVGSNLGEGVGDILTALEADEKISNKRLPLLKNSKGVRKNTERQVTSSYIRDIPKKKLQEETAKLDKVLGKIKTHSITKTNELFYAGAVVVTNWFVLKLYKAAKRKEPMRRRRLQNKIKKLSKRFTSVGIIKG